MDSKTMSPERHLDKTDRDPAADLRAECPACDYSSLDAGAVLIHIQRKHEVVDRDG